MTEIITEFNESIATTAIEANLFEFYKLFRHVPGTQLFDGPHFDQTVTVYDNPRFNCVFNAKIAPEQVSDAIDLAIHRAQQHGFAFTWWVGPASEPSDLEQHLQARGFWHAGGTPGMAVDLLALEEDQPRPSNLVIRRIEDDESLKTWSNILTVSFSMEPDIAAAFDDVALAYAHTPNLPYIPYMAWLDDQPVAVSALVTAVGIAGIYNVATLPQARGQGIGAAITLAPLLEARAEGYRIGTLLSSKMGLPVYHRLGFRQYSRMRSYMWEPDNSTQLD